MQYSNYKIFYFSFLFTITAFFIGINNIHAESPPVHEDCDESVPLEFVPNQNQYNPKVTYSIGLGGMDKMFLTDEGFTYILHNQEQVDELHDIKLERDSARMKSHLVSGHVYNIDIIGADFSRSVGHEVQSHKYNYFKGNDPAKWASNVPVYHETEFSDIYTNIDMKVYSDHGMPKYDFIIHPGGNPELIKSNYIGTDNTSLKNGNLYIQTSVKTIIEAAPYAYQILEGKKVEIECQYKLKEGILSYHFPNGYHKNETLIIDPTVIGATVSGYIGFQIFGHTSCFDNSGNIYNGGTAFDMGLITTTGAFESNYADPVNSNRTDMAFHKYNSDASQLIYGTYIGGDGDDYPHSTIVDDYGQLCILGSTQSADFPTTLNAYQRTIGGGTDITITKLSEDGSSLIGSTFVGGLGSDGLNLSYIEAAYGENFRGEIILDNQGDIYITSVSSSFDFPITPNAYQRDLNTQAISQPIQDAVVLKINSDLSTLFWSTFLGGDQADTGFGIRVTDNGEVYVTGIAGDPNFANLNSTWPGGMQSAYIVKLSSDGQRVEKETFYGTSGTDHSYFLDIDEDHNVHIYGRTTGVIIPTENTYTSGINGKQFLAAFNGDLDQLIYQTTIGNNLLENYNFVPSAFMVDKCNSIYFSGYDAEQDLPTTSDAILSNVSQNAFYLGVLTPYAESMSFGTYFGHADHVDGGTSRFDKGGIVYQGVCSCIDDNFDRRLSTTPNAYARVQTSRCDMGMFKIDFDIATVTAKAAVSPGASGCAPFAADFTYTGQDGEEFFWDFGDGSTTTDKDPSHTFVQAGEYTITLIASAPGTCNENDTTLITINVLNEGSNISDTILCEGINSLFLDATIANGSFIWQDGSSTSTYSVEEPGTYWVDIYTSGCSQRDSFVVSGQTVPNDLDLGGNQILCDIPSYTLVANNLEGNTYNWSTGETSNEISVSEAGIYGVTVTSEEGCMKFDAVNVTIGTTPNIALSPDSIVCQGESVLLSVPIESDAVYTWQDGSNGNNHLAQSPGTYILTAEIDGCFATEEFVLSYAETPDVEYDISNVLCKGDCNGSIEITSVLQPDLDIEWQSGIDLNQLCQGNYNVTLTDEYGCKYPNILTIESPSEVISNVTFDNVSCPEAEDGVIDIVTSGGIGPYQYQFNNSSTGEVGTQSTLSGGIYSWHVSDANGCTNSGVIDIYEPPEINIYAGTDTIIKLGESTLFDSWVDPIENQLINWDNFEFLDCFDCETPLATPVNTTIFEMTVQDPITGCEIKDQIEVRVKKDRVSYIPNVITPNGDGNNDWVGIFGNKGIRQIRSFKIFDRWGELIFIKEGFAPNDHQLGWDGKFNGRDVVLGVYVYLAEVEYLDDHIEVLSGDITVIR